MSVQGSVHIRADPRRLPYQTYRDDAVFLEPDPDEARFRACRRTGHPVAEVGWP